MKKLVTKHKRLIIIVLIALIIIGAAYYFTLGKPTGQKTDISSGENSTGGSNSSSPSSTSSSYPNSQMSSSGFPLKWAIKNSYTSQLQKRLNLSITTCNKGTALLEDGILGDKTVAAIKTFFPNIGSSVATNRQVSKTEYDIIINSKPGC